MAYSFVVTKITTELKKIICFSLSFVHWTKLNQVWLLCLVQMSF